jgi:MFS family permease
MVQGGMRRQIAKIGEKQAAVFGLACGIVGFLMLAFANNLTLFYTGMAIFSVSSGLASICLPALVSLYSDAQSQGRNLGSSRAAQALGRAIGPLLAALIYFYAGPKASYSFGAIALLLPIWLAIALPPPQKG